MVMEQCRQREKYVNYLRKLDQELCRHGSQMDSTLNLLNRCEILNSLIISINYILMVIFTDCWS